MSRSRTRHLAAALLLAGSLALTGCGKPAAQEAEGEAHAKVEAVPGNGDLKQVVLSPAALKALGVRTAQVVTATDDDGGKSLAIPYSAVIYDAHGKAFAFTNPRPLTYIRQPIEVDDVKKDRAFLTKGPAAGTSVVTVGADELLGAEEGVEEE